MVSPFLHLVLLFFLTHGYKPDCMIFDKFSASSFQLRCNYHPPLILVITSRMGHLEFPVPSYPMIASPDSEKNRQPSLCLYTFFLCCFGCSKFEVVPDEPWPGRTWNGFKLVHLAPITVTLPAFCPHVCRLVVCTYITINGLKRSILCTGATLT